MWGEWGYLEGERGGGGGCSYLLHAAGLGVVGLDDGERITKSNARCGF